MRSKWHLEDGRWVLRVRSPLTEEEFLAVAADLKRRKAAHGKGLRSTTGLAETVARMDRRCVERLAEVFAHWSGEWGRQAIKDALRALRLGRLAQSAERRAKQRG